MSLDGGGGGWWGGDGGGDGFGVDAAVIAAAAVMRRLSPVAWAPGHRKSDLRHALCALLVSVLTPVGCSKVFHHTVHHAFS
jgi:hypothetical protein